MIKFRPVAAIAAVHACGKQGHLEVQSTQQRGKGAVRLVAEAAPTFMDNLVEKAVFIADDLSSQADIKILKWNGKHVGAM